MHWEVLHDSDWINSCFRVSYSQTVEVYRIPRERWFLFWLLHSISQFLSWSVTILFMMPYIHLLRDVIHCACHSFSLSTSNMMSKVFRENITTSFDNIRCFKLAILSVLQYEQCDYGHNEKITEYSDTSELEWLGREQHEIFPLVLITDLVALMTNFSASIEKTLSVCRDNPLREAQLWPALAFEIIHDL